MNQLQLLSIMVSSERMSCMLTTQEMFFLLILDILNWVFSYVASLADKWMFLSKNTADTSVAETSIIIFSSFIEEYSRNHQEAVIWQKTKKQS